MSCVLTYGFVCYPIIFVLIKVIDMYSFKNDYAEGAHPTILHKLVETNLVQQTGYGEDEYSIQAKDILRKKIQNPEAVIYFVSGVTQANVLIISSLLLPHEVVIIAKTVHIYAIETNGK